MLRASVRARRFRDWVGPVRRASCKGALGGGDEKSTRVMRTVPGNLPVSWQLLSCLIFLFLPVALHAGDIVAYRDEKGRIVYVNVDPMPVSSRTVPVLRQPADPRINRLLRDAARKHELDPTLVQAVIQVESNYNPKAVSRKGALGLMQLIPATARRYGVSDPFDPQQNIEGGVRHLRDLLDLFEGDLNLALAGYNAGVNAVSKYGDIPPYRETRNYVTKVMSLYHDGGSTGPAWTGRSARIQRHVDENGVVHFTDEGF